MPYVLAHQDTTANQSFNVDKKPLQVNFPTVVVSSLLLKNTFLLNREIFLQNQNQNVLPTAIARITKPVLIALAATPAPKVLTFARLTPIAEYNSTDHTASAETD